MIYSTEKIVGLSLIFFITCTSIYSQSDHNSQPQTPSASAPAEKSPYKLPGLTIPVDGRIGTVVYNFNRGKQLIDTTTNERIPNFSHLRRVMLHNSFDTDKTEIAKGVARATDSDFVELSGSGIINPFQDAGATTVKDTFADIRQRLKNPAASVVLFINKMDGASSDTTQVDLRNEHSELMRKLDHFRLERRLLVIGSTDSLSFLPGGTLSRFYTRIEVKTPTLEQRTQLLQTEFSRFNSYLAGIKPLLTQEQLTLLSRETEGVSNCLLMELVENLAEKSYSCGFTLSDATVAQELQQAKDQLALELKDIQLRRDIENDKEEERIDRRLEREHRARVRADYEQEKRKS